MQTVEDIVGDLERCDNGDREIWSAYEYLRSVCKKKGVPYREPLKSKTTGHIKYLLMELHDERGTVFITDLDSNQTFTLVDGQKPPSKPRRKYGYEMFQVAA